MVEVTEERHDAFEESKAMAMEAFQKVVTLPSFVAVQKHSLCWMNPPSSIIHGLVEPNWVVESFCFVQHLCL